MKSTKILKYIISVMVFFSGPINSSAQVLRIAIVSLADTTIVNQHVGVTIFGNFTDTLHLKFAVSTYIEEQLLKYLTPFYNVSIIQLPDSVTKENSKLFGKWGMNKAIKKWIGDSRNLYDLVIFTYNGQIPREMNLLIPENTSGLYSRGRNTGYFTSIFFSAYRTNNLAEIEYYSLGGKLISPLKDFKLPDDGRSLTPKMLDMVKSGFEKHLDSRIVHFLTKTYFVDQSKIDNINSGATVK